MLVLATPPLPCGSAAQLFLIRKWAGVSASSSCVPLETSVSVASLIRASTSHSTVCSSSKVSRLRPTVFLTATFADLTIRKKYPLHQGVPLHHRTLPVTSRSPGQALSSPLQGCCHSHHRMTTCRC
ncbi:hypothetical protein T12_2256 [Trichinella patagoniensis]|uniref:Uncharacterized protein n=1 Tax=Trichinella patagoniensis TaxID=990121 RepID=A0A0V0ZMX4_9BILA|nr:hypothetical protein T12_2256 [Trichinella patagoniensis]